MPARRPLLATALALPALLALAGCAAPERIRAPAPPLVGDELTRLPLYDGHTGERLAWADVIDRLAASDAVLIGESHGHPVGLPAAARAFEDVIDRAPARGALALEFFGRDDQRDLDAYLAGDTARDDFIAEHANKLPSDHERMALAARDAGWPVVAANAPRPLVRRARTDGYDALEASLTDDERAFLVIPDRLAEGAYRDRFFEVMGAMRDHASDDTDHDGLDPRIFAFYRAQQVWDATMADTLERLVEDGHAPAVLVVGRFHVDHAGDTKARLRAALDDDDVVTAITFIERPLGLIGLRDEDRHAAEIVVYTGPRPR